MPLLIKRTSSRFSERQKQERTNRAGFLWIRHLGLPPPPILKGRYRTSYGATASVFAANSGITLKTSKAYLTLPNGAETWTP